MKWIKTIITSLTLVFILGTYAIAHYFFKKREIESYEAFYQKEEKTAREIIGSTFDSNTIEPNLNQERIKVLVVEGGGAKGLYALRILNYLEKKTGKPISELYDVMGGTSIGSLLVSLLSTPQDGKPKFTAREILDVFSKVAHTTLDPSLGRKILTGFGILSPILNNQKYIQKLEEVYGHIRLSETLNHLILYGFNYNSNQLIAFDNRGSPLNYADPLLYQLIGGTTSPWGFAPPNRLIFNYEHNPQFVGDAALVLNSPLFAIILEVSKIYPNKKLLITHITLSPKELEYTTDFNYFEGSAIALKYLRTFIGEARNQLIRHWIDILSKTTIYKFDNLLEVGINQNNEWSNIDSLDFSERNLKKIDKFARHILNVNKEALDAVASELLKD